MYLNDSRYKEQVEHLPPQEGRWSGYTTSPVSKVLQEQEGCEVTCLRLHINRLTQSSLVM